MRFHHIGIVCAKLSAGKDRLDEILGPLKWSDAFDDPIQRVSVQFGTDNSGICYELIAPTDERSPVNEALRQGKNILNHVAYTVSSVAEEAERLRQRGCLPLGPAQPAVAFDGARIQFFITPLRSILELIEEKQSA